MKDKLYSVSSKVLAQHIGHAIHLEERYDDGKRAFWEVRCDEEGCEVEEPLFSMYHE